MEHRTRWPCIVALTLLLVAAACGGDDGRVRRRDRAAPTPAPTGPLPLERFHYVASLTLQEARFAADARRVAISTEGDFQWPDRHAFSYSTQFGTTVIRQSVVVIGGEAWLREGEEPWRRVTQDELSSTGLLSSAFTTIRPGFIVGGEFERVRESVPNLPSTEEAANGVPADRYTVGVAGQDYLRAFLEDDQLLSAVRDVSWELWLARDGGWPVRLLAKATIVSPLPVLTQLALPLPTLWELLIDVSRPNDPTLTIVAPPAP
jgi:hypothetical protein